MAEEKCKVYYDGSHYIAIKHTTNPAKPRRVIAEETIVINEKEQSEVSAVTENKDPPMTADKLPPAPRIMTKKELFDELYTKYIDLRKSERRKRILEDMAEYFDTPQQADAFIAENFERKERNLICRRIRMSRKANQQKWNYFVTFTYDDALHTEDSFRKGLMNRLSLFSSRKKWRYIGVWERSPERKRLHFHGIFFIPDGTMPGELVEVSDYSFNSKKRQTTVQNTYFNTYFGRSDFEEIDEHLTAQALQYMLKYIEKTGERIVYSRGLYQYFISDIMDDDIVCVTGTDENKFILFDDFSCFDEGVYVGPNSPEVRAQMRKSN